MLDNLKRFVRLPNPNAFPRPMRDHLDRYTRMYYKWEVDRDFAQTASRLEPFIAHVDATPDPKKVALFVSFSTWIAGLKLELLLAKRLQLAGYTPVFLTFSGAKIAHRYFKLFGFDHVVDWEPFVKENQPADRDYQAIARSLISEPLRIRDIKDCDYRGVPVGKHALSRVSRDLVQGRLDLNEPAQHKLFIEALAEAILNTDVSHILFDKMQPSVTFVREFGYTPYAQPFAVGLTRGVPGVNWHPGQRAGCWVFKRHYNLERPKVHLSIDDSTWQRLREYPLLEEQNAALESEFKERYRPDSKHDIRRLQEGKRLKTREEIVQQLGLDGNKKTAVIFSHLTWDATFFFGTDLYEDFEDWLVETVRVAAENTEVNWIVKLHPANVLKLQQKGDISRPSELIALQKLGELPPHIKILGFDTDINTWSLYSAIDYGLTVRGTIGFELPCFGIPVLTAGTGAYSGFGFTIDSKTKEEYVARLRHIQDIPKPTPAEIELARKHAYYVLLQRQASLEDVAHVTHLSSDQALHPLQINIEMKLKSILDLQNSPTLDSFIEWVENVENPDLLTNAKDTVPMKV